MRIENCAFVSIVIDGKRYTSDLVIYPDGRIEGPWYRKRGHILSSEDIEELIKSDPEVIIAGTGVNGLVKPEKELEKLLDKNGIEFHSAPNGKAMGIYNEISSKKNVGACFHLTC